MNIVEKQPLRTNTFVSERHNRIIKWMEGGRIVHSDLNKNILGIEKYSKASLSKIIRFLEKDTTIKVDRVADFNVASHDLINEIEGFEILQDGDSFFGISRKKKESTNKINRRFHKGQQKVSMYLPVDQNWKTNMRYKICIENDGSVVFEEFEAITSENLNMEYAEPLLNVYETVEN